MYILAVTLLLYSTLITLAKTFSDWGIFRTISITQLLTNKNYARIIFTFGDTMTSIASQLQGSIWVPYKIKSCSIKYKKCGKATKAVALTHCADCIPRRLLHCLRQMPHNLVSRSSQPLVAQLTI
jgi:hypothetical protein